MGKNVGLIEEVGEGKQEFLFAVQLLAFFDKR